MGTWVRRTATWAGLLVAGVVLGATLHAPVGREALRPTAEPPANPPGMALRIENGQIVTFHLPAPRPLDIDPTCHGYGPGAGGSFTLVLPVAESPGCGPSAAQIPSNSTVDR